MDVRPYVEGLGNRARSWAKQCESARQRAREDAKKMAAFLVAAGASKVVLFGSLVGGARFTPQSNIDLAVEGIDWPAYWRILSELERMSAFNVDLVILEDADPEFGQRIILEGEDLLESRGDSSGRA